MGRTRKEIVRAGLPGGLATRLLAGEPNGRRSCSAPCFGIGATGCGGAHRTPRTKTALTLPRSLAQAWAPRADAIGAVASAGQGCQAQALADSLREDVVNADARVPTALRVTLLRSVNALADRIRCTSPTTTATAPPATLPQPPHKHRLTPPEHGHQGSDTQNQGNDNPGHGQGGSD